jgi:AcrR family transcriptional regulator
MSSQERLLEAGLELFHCYGIYPVGLDRILAHAGVTKTTFYKYFESKEAFVCAVLDVFAEQLLKQFSNGQAEKSDQEIRAQLLGLFNAWDSCNSMARSAGACCFRQVSPAVTPTTQRAARPLVISGACSKPSNRWPIVPGSSAQNASRRGLGRFSIARSSHDNFTATNRRPAKHAAWPNS